MAPLWANCRSALLRSRLREAIVRIIVRIYGKSKKMQANVQMFPKML